MQKPSVYPSKIAPKEMRVGINECRLARQGERLVARDVLADVVVTIQVPAAGFAAMLRFSAPEERAVSRQRLAALWDFADQALELLFQSIRSMDIPSDQVAVSAMGGADLAGITFGRGKQLSLAIQRSLWKHGIILKGNDLGGAQSRLIWLESASGRLIVRSKSPETSPVEDVESAHAAQQRKAS
jgi:chemotaxis receptor (MCP) glutamine deamidase CheD